MKEIFVKLVYAEDSAKIEKLFNVYRIGLNEWGKTGSLNYQGTNLISYTIICTRDTFNAIESAMDCN